MQFEKASDLDFSHAQTSSRMSRMLQSGQAMEDQWKGILQQIVDSGSWSNPKTGAPWIPNQDLLDPVKEVIENMEGELAGQQALNSEIMGNHTAAIVACNSARDAALTGTVATKLQASRTAEDAHSDCRDAEDTKITDMEQKCGVFEGLQKCGHEQDWFAGYEEGDAGPGSLKEAVTAAVACKSTIAAATSQATTCDTAQTTFRDAWCSYASELDTVCSTHESCYDLQKSNWNAASDSITVLQKEQKTIFRMLGRIRCYLEILFRRSQEGTAYVPKQSDIETCQDTAITKDGHLDVNYGSIAERGLCKGADNVKDEPTDNGPGSTTWYDTKFGGMKTHDKLNSNSACP